MLRRLLGVLLALLVLQPLVPSTAHAADKSSPKKIAKIKAKVQKYAASREIVTIRLNDEKLTELRGMITEVGDEEFVVAERDTSTPRRLAYKDVVAVWGKGLRRTRMLIGIGVGVGAVLGIAYLLTPRN